MIILHPLISFLLVPSTFFCVRIHTFWLIFLGLIGWGKALYTGVYTKLFSYKFQIFTLCVLAFYSPLISLYCLCACGLLFIKQINKTYLYYGIVLTLFLVLFDTFGFSFPFVKRVRGDLHTAPCLFAVILIWCVFNYLFQSKKYIHFSGLFALAFLTFKRSHCDSAFLMFILGSLAAMFKNNLALAKKISYSYFLLFLLPLFLPLSTHTIQKINGYMPISSYVHRLYIASDVCKSIKQGSLLQKFFGHGVNTSKNSLKKELNWHYINPNKTRRPYPQGYFHPHNIALQILLDLGILGLIFFIFFFVRIKFQTQARLQWFVCTLGISSISVGLFEWWWMAIVFLSYRIYYDQNVYSKK